MKNSNPNLKKNVQVENAMQGVQFIAQHIRDNDKDNEVRMKIHWNVGMIIQGNSGDGRGLEIH